MVRTIVVSQVGWTSYKGYFRAAPHVVSGERCALPHVASGERCASPHVARGDRRAALDAVSYRALLERLVQQWLVLEPLVLDRMVLERLAASEPQRLTPLASAQQRPPQPLVREGKTRLDARSVCHSCWRPPQISPEPPSEALKNERPLN
jgi:hypothetical protein